MGGVPFLHDDGRFAFKIGIVIYPMFFQPGEGLCGQFQVLQLCPMPETALFGLEIVKQADTVVTLLRLAGRSGTSGDPGNKSFFGVVHPQRFQTGEPFLIRCSGRDILAALDLITFSLQAAKQFFQIGTGWQKSVDGHFQLRLIAGAVPYSLMFNIALSFVLSGDDDGQTVFFVNPVRSAADEMIAPLVGMVVLMIRKADRIENQVIMNMIFVYMSGKYKLILAAQDFFCELHADLMGLFRRDLPRLKGLDQVVAQVRSLVDGMAAGPGKFDIRSFGGAAIGGHQQLYLFSVNIRHHCKKSQQKDS